MVGKQTHRYYPIFLDVGGKKCVVIGGGEVALRKVTALLDYGACVKVVSPELCPGLSKLARNNRIEAVSRNYEFGDLKDAFLAIAATDHGEINQSIASEARERKIIVNIVDNQKHSDFIAPAYFCRGDLTVAVSTAGKSPALAIKVKNKLEKSLGEEYASLVSLIEEVRTEIKKKPTMVSDDRWQEVIDLDLLGELLKNGQYEKAKTALLNNLTKLH